MTDQLDAAIAAHRRGRRRSQRQLGAAIRLARRRLEPAEFRTWLVDQFGPPRRRRP